MYFIKKYINVGNSVKKSVPSSVSLDFLLDICEITFILKVLNFEKIFMKELKLISWKL